MLPSPTIPQLTALGSGVPLGLAFCPGLQSTARNSPESAILAFEFTRDANRRHMLGVNENSQLKLSLVSCNPSEFTGLNS